MSETLAAQAQPPWRVLCVDDEANILSALRRMLRPAGYQVSIAGSGAEGLALLAREPVDLVISDMRMPEMDGAQFLEQVRQRWPDTVRILLTGYADITSTVTAINKGEIYRYISKPWNDAELLLTVREALERKALEREKARLEALTAHQNEQLRDLNANLERKVEERTAALAKAHEKLKTSFLTSIKIFSNLIEMRGPTLSGHSRRVADLSRRIAVRLGLPAGETQDIFLAGLLHDIGKIGFPDALLVRPVEQLAGDALNAYRTHAARGEQALMSLPELRSAARLIRAHHERFDGYGYPDALSGTAIPVGARILAVANDYDGLQIGTLTTRRYSHEDATSQIAEGRGRRYDPQVVEALLHVLGAIDSDHGRGREIRVEELEPGMVLSRDLMSREGVLLLSGDYVLDANLIRQIRDYANDGDLAKIYVRTDAMSHEKHHEKTIAR